MLTNEHFIQKEISFKVDGLNLKGVLHLPDIRQPPLVIGSHGLYSSGDSPKQIALAEHCNRQGIAYFRFDHRGCGRSEGDFERVTCLEGRRRDLMAAIETIRNTIDTSDHLGLFGSSMGGTVCLSTAARLTPDAMVIIAAPIRSNLTNSKSDISKTEIVLDSAKRHFDITQELSKISHIMIFHGDSDEVVPVAHAREIFKLATKPKKLIIQKRGDHRMSNPEHQQDFIRKTSLWFKQNLRE
ncbi:MAG: alpha/beta fold hydrolase [Desulfobacterales bacterium]|jgi:dipeptidyl aminopeptidase/acylaminoacyl peptidase